ncbi:hypothetical protein [Salmonella enterica]|uniref:Uncharacterized protein n=2 Tax=Salmonella enterica TaxID=28901 RepID=A0A7U7L9H2_SALER|nr:hypothetical protein [Salmonella enterica]EAA8668690.1 hypothetical protein [Salmonella enterica]PTU39646.1 hypothetical protein DAY03_24090 [Salmonella enterica subsp. enterica]
MKSEKYKLSLVKSLKGRTGVYGFAKSYTNDNSKDDTPPPYFYRGELNNQIIANETINIKADQGFLSEEMEIIWLFSVENGSECKFIGFSFGNDITDLAEFRKDAARILHAKKNKASICKHWWESDTPPSDLDIKVTRHRNKKIKNYDSKLGSNFISLTFNDTVKSIKAMAGWDNFDFIMLFTGAPRGFAWLQNEPILSDDIYDLHVKGFGMVLSNRIKFYD